MLRIDDAMHPATGAANSPSPRAVEIVGLAGSGKSTIAKALCAESRQAVTARGFVPSAASNLPFCARQIASCLLPLMWRNRTTGISRRQAKSVLYLNGWHQVLRRQMRQTPATVVLDQGPVFRLTNLQGFGPEWLRSTASAPWWESVYSQWARFVEVLIWLEAPEEILIQRIHDRKKWHPVKELEEAQARQFLSIYRNTCHDVVERLAAHRRLRILRFDTSSTSPAETVGAIQSALAQSHAS
jgi:shikimate kinase